MDIVPMNIDIFLWPNSTVTIFLRCNSLRPNRARNFQKY